MTKYVELNAVLDAIGNQQDGTGMTFEALSHAMRDVMSLPQVETVPVKHGHWEEVPYKTVEHGEVVIRGKTVRCSICKHAEKGWNKGMNYCPNCGSRNVKEND